MFVDIEGKFTAYQRRIHGVQSSVQYGHQDPSMAVQELKTILQELAVQREGWEQTRIFFLFALVWHDVSSLVQPTQPQQVADLPQDFSDLHGKQAQIEALLTQPRSVVQSAAGNDAGILYEIGLRKLCRGGHKEKSDGEALMFDALVLARIQDDMLLIMKILFSMIERASDFHCENDVDSYLREIALLLARAAEETPQKMNEQWHVLANKLVRMRQQGKVVEFVSQTHSVV